MTDWHAIDFLVLGGLLVGLIACVGGLLYARRERLLTHAERMKALELGRDLPDDPATARVKATARAEQIRQDLNKVASSGTPKSLAAQCYSTTSYVCGSGFVFAWLAQGNFAVALAIASATGAVGVTGLICGTVLASKQIESSNSAMDVYAKPRFDPEAV